MAYKDVREFITRLEQNGDVQPIEDEVDWNLEVGAITRRCCELRKPAPFFQKIKDYPPGFRILGDPLATFRRFASAMDLPLESSYSQLLEAYDERRKNTLKPMLLTDGPCKEKVYKGDEVNLFKLPAPLIHGGDGGRYIGAWHLIATKDPESDWVNWGMYRVMIHDRNTVGILITPFQHIGVIFNKYEKILQRPMEFAVAVGTEPITALVATSAVPYGVSEVDVIGGIRREPLELVRCETVDLLVPATAEIVLEGEVLPNERRNEGPFGEYPGFQVSGSQPRPVGKIKAITHRKDPIITFCSEGMPFTSGHIAAGITHGSDLRSELLRVGIPLTGIYLSPESSNHLCVVATRTPYPNIATQIASLIWANKNGRGITKIIVIDADEDPSDLNQVVHSFATKCDPARGTTIIERGLGSALIPYVDPKDREWGKASKILFDCTWPLDWPKEAVPKRASFQNIYPEEVKEKVLKKWDRYFNPNV